MAGDNLNPTWPPNSAAPAARQATWCRTDLAADVDAHPGHAHDGRELDTREHEDAVGTDAAPGMR